MPRIARVVVPEYPHHITQRGNNKSDIFIDNNDQEREDYAKIIIKSSMEENIRKATSTGRPLCGERFFDKVEGILNRDLKIKKAGGPCYRKT